MVATVHNCALKKNVVWRIWCFWKRPIFPFLVSSLYLTNKSNFVIQLAHLKDLLNIDLFQSLHQFALWSSDVKQFVYSCFYLHCIYCKQSDVKINASPHFSTMCHLIYTLNYNAKYLANPIPNIAWWSSIRKSLVSL